ncbi:MAG: hypothetical protein HY560_07350 [Gemmatimonadetes bacterium]|nr:hypothetical protein [Gemmatimonadota bacterium]
MRCGWTARFISLLLWAAGALAALTSPAPAQRAGDTLVVLGGLPSQAAAGEPIGVPIRIRPAPGRSAQAIRVHVVAGRASYVAGAIPVTDSTGAAVFPDLRVFGRPGPVTLGFTDGVAVLPWQITLTRGLTRAKLARQPFPRIAGDSLFRSQPVIHVADAADNPDTAEVSVKICRIEDGDAAKCRNDTSGMAALLGTTSISADQRGRAEFTDLAFSGPEGRYRLVFSVRGLPDSIAGDTSDVMLYDPGRDLNRSYVVVSAIKSIAGRVPEAEFFDARFRFRYGPTLFALAGFDVSLANRSTDTVRSSQELLTEAHITLNGSLYTSKDSTTSRPERSLFGGAQLRVFNTLPYWGFHMGSVEHAGSAFEGSTFTLGLLFRLSADTTVVDTEKLIAEKVNVFTDFFLRSTVIPFFQTLNLRGGVLLPLSGERRVSSRIAVSVPIGTITFF